MRFLDFLKEEQDQPGSWMFKNTDDIIAFLKGLGLSNAFISNSWVINNQGKIIHSRNEIYDRYLVDTGAGKKGMPFMMKRSYNFTISEDSKLGTLLGIPELVEGDFSLDSPDLISLEHFPKEITQNAFLWVENVKSIECKNEFVNNLQLLMTTFPSLHNFHRSFPKVFTLGFGQNKITESILSLLLVKELQSISFHIKYPEPFKIINKHLIEKDILECKTELIENGFSAYAKL
jgi:hypothetical protein